MQECERLAVEILPVFCKPAASVEPGKGPLDNPSFRQNDELVQFVALDDFDYPFAALICRQCGAWPLIARVGEDAQDEREQGTRALIENACRPVAILDIGGMNDGVQQEAERIYENVALLALDLFSRIVAMRIDARPPFSALLTLWLSMIAALGLAWRSSRSLHAT